MVGDSNVAFYKQLRAAGLDGTRVVLLSTVVSERDRGHRQKDSAAGYYAYMGYFQSLKNPASERFVKAFKAKIRAGPRHRRPDGSGLQPSVYLWKLPSRPWKAGSFSPDKVIT